MFIYRSIGHYKDLMQMLTLGIALGPTSRAEPPLTRQGWCRSGAKPIFSKNGVCKANFPNFISFDEVSANSPEQNSTDDSVWSILEAEVCSKRYRSVDSSKKVLQKA
ncbi:hypothetical protein Y032_0310g2110 [Ancylostoma ceylanicum]|uniref:Uncharacterized protein n=1 Tax=Ancylostoma ceylanicum TaxID=53326 RepID=A0A016S2A7_9BILA|nr:hypothetical protein Y032_0310g2110 [Ancylostoma ceylanicum]